MLSKDMLVNNFHLVEVILIGWKIFFGLCKLLFLRHHYDVNEQYFFNLVRDQNIPRKKCDNALHIGEGLEYRPFSYVKYAVDLI
jgi:hypothetical protein